MNINDISYFETYDNGKITDPSRFSEKDKIDFFVDLLSEIKKELSFSYLFSVVHFDQEESIAHIHSMIVD